MRLAIAISALVALSATGGRAQGEGERPDSTPEARLAIETYGKCVAKREPRETRRVLLMDFTSDRYDNAIHRLSDEARRDCARASLEHGMAMRSAHLLFAGALAEALLEADTAPLNVRLARQAGIGAASYSATDKVAQCLVRSLPDQAAALFVTTPGTEAESAAAAPLSQAVPACAHAAGIASQIELTVPAVRAMLATAAYRLVASAENANA